jgi:hypothetical protein
LPYARSESKTGFHFSPIAAKVPQRFRHICSKDPSAAFSIQWKEADLQIEANILGDSIT